MMQKCLKLKAELPLNGGSAFLLKNRNWDKRKYNIYFHISILNPVFQDFNGFSVYF
jgi:hypothetical protein